MSAFFAESSQPATELGRYRIMSTTCGARVSPLCLGGMSLGQTWEWMGTMDKEQSFALLDAFYQAGGNFVDTSINYHDGESEHNIGEWMTQRNNRDEMFLATKYTAQWRKKELGFRPQIANFTGNSRKTLLLSVEESLRRLGTSYIDLLWLHTWEYTTSIAEVMDSLHSLVQQGKVLYLGISDTPAWVVAEANTYARHTNKTPFSAYQGRWSLTTRDAEREVVPMARRFGMALCPWGVLGGGSLQTEEEMQQRRETGDTGRSRAYEIRSDEDRLVAEALSKVAAEIGSETTVQQVALAWIMSKAPYVFPIVGGRKVHYLRDNIKALKLRLTRAQIGTLEAAKPFDLGFPINFFGDDPQTTGISQPWVSSSSHVAQVRGPAAIGYEGLE